MDPRDSPIILQQILQMAQGLPAPLQAALNDWVSRKMPGVPTDPQLVAVINAALIGNGWQALPTPAGGAGMVDEFGAQLLTPTGQPQSQRPTEAGARQIETNAQQRTGGSVPGTPPVTTPPAAATAPPAVPNTGGGGTTVPNVGDPLSIAPGSAVANAPLYGGAQAGKEGPLALLMDKTLRDMGLDPYSGNAAVESIRETLAPYLQLVMAYSGMGDESQVPGDLGPQYAANFAKMATTPGTFGQFRKFGSDLSGRIGGLLADPTYGDTNRQATVNDLLMLSTAGGNQYENAAMQRRAVADRRRYGLESSLDPQHVNNYLTWLYSDPQRRTNPAYRGIAGLLGR